MFTYAIFAYLVSHCIRIPKQQTMAKNVFSQTGFDLAKKIDLYFCDLDFFPVGRQRKTKKYIMYFFLFGKCGQVDAHCNNLTSMGKDETF